MTDERIYSLATLVAMVVLQLIQSRRLVNDAAVITTNVDTKTAHISNQLGDHVQNVNKRMDERDEAIQHLHWLGNGVIGGFKHAYMLATRRIADLTHMPHDIAIADEAQKVFETHKAALEAIERAEVARATVLIQNAQHSHPPQE